MFVEQPLASLGSANNQDNHPLSEIFTLLQNKQQQTDGFLEDSPVDNISSSKDPSSFPFCDEAYKFVKRTLGPFPPFSRLLSYLHKRGTRYCWAWGQHSFETNKWTMLLETEAFFPYCNRSTKMAGIIWLGSTSVQHVNKPAAQAAGQTLPRWRSTNRPNPPLQ